MDESFSWPASLGHDRSNMGVPRSAELRQIVPVMFARHRDGAFSGPHILHRRKSDRVKVQHYSSKGSTTEAVRIGSRFDVYVQSLATCRGSLNWEGDLARAELERRARLEAET